MRRGKMDVVFSVSRQRCFQILIALGLLYFVVVTLEIPFVFRYNDARSSSGDALTGFLTDPLPSLQSEEDRQEIDAPMRPRKLSFKVSEGDALGPAVPSRGSPNLKILSGLKFMANVNDTKGNQNRGFSELQKSAKDAWELGATFWKELLEGSSTKAQKESKKSPENLTESCPHSISLTGAQFADKRKLLVLPCGLTLGSHITLVGKPFKAHEEYDPKISPLKDGSESVLVSQFMMELQGLKTVDGEDPPRILHFNPRLKGDWSGKPVIEQNTCYRMQWGSALRCEGWKSKADEETGIKFYTFY